VVRFLKTAGALACLVLLPTLAFAQASITGVVKDSSGAVLPGVTVEASSPVLIEKSRTAVTDGEGLYRIIDLRPGTYTVTFSLTGFNAVKREGVELSGTFIATINADMKIGSIEETITVSGETPIVDTENVRRQTTLAGQTLTEIPMAKSWAATAFLIPGITIQAGVSADIQVTPNMTVFGGAGGRLNEGRMQLDGLNVGAALNGGGVSTYVADIQNSAEVVTTTSGGLGEAEVGGPTLSIVPKSGGNTFKSSAYLGGVPSGWVQSNYTPALQAAGLATPGSEIFNWDFTGGEGGPIKKDRLWFYVTARNEGEYRTIPGVFPNLNAGVAGAYLYKPDTSKVAEGAQSFGIYTGRLTIQATPRNKFNLHWDSQLSCNGATYDNSSPGCRQQNRDGAFVGALGLGGLTSTTSPETSGYLGHTLIQNRQVTWSSPVTNKLLLEAGLGSYRSRWGPMQTPGNPTAPFVRITELCVAGCAANGGIANLTYNSMNYANDWDNPNTWRASASYVTGAHNFKFGYIGGLLIENIENFTNNQNLAYSVSNGVPTSLTLSENPYNAMYRVGYNAWYAQDQWTHNRMTLQGALRFDRATSWNPPQSIPASNYLGAPISFGEVDGVNYKNFSPRVGLAYDVFGNGKTALKVNYGKYLDPASNLNNNYSITNPISRLATTTTRTWKDSNGDYIPQCNLSNPAANGECQADTNQLFGTNQYQNLIDPSILSIRPIDYQFGVSVQQQVAARVSVEVGYFHRWLQNFFVTDNVLVPTSGFQQFSLTAPSDPRLPGGGGYVVNNLYNVLPQYFGQTLNNLTTEQNFSNSAYQHYNGALLNVSARATKGLTLQGGINTGSTVEDVCGARAQLPEMTAVGGFQSLPIGPTNPYCHNAPGFITKVTGIATYIVPKVDVLFSTTFRSDQGAPLAANWNPSSTAILNPILGRPVAGGAPFLTVNMVAPGQVWGDRVNEFDVKLAKVIRFKQFRSNVGIDVFNLLNSNAILSYNQTYSPTVPAGPGGWLQPLQVLTPRFFKISAQIDF
jgi:hypothetical protein